MRRKSDGERFLGFFFVWLNSNQQHLYNRDSHKWVVFEISGVGHYKIICNHYDATSKRVCGQCVENELTNNGGCHSEKECAIILIEKKNVKFFNKCFSNVWETFNYSDSMETENPSLLRLHTPILLMKRANCFQVCGILEIHMYDTDYWFLILVREKRNHSKEKIIFCVQNIIVNVWHFK